MEKLAYAAYGFYLFLIIIGAFSAVRSENLVRSLIGLLMTLFGVAGMYFLLAAPFIALMQILIYVGAVSVLIFFAIMLVRETGSEAGIEVRGRGRARAFLSIMSGLIPLGFIAMAWIRYTPKPMALKPEASLVALGQALTGPYVLAFELISVVLLAAMAGAVILGFERRKSG
jgi:NADH:ubiquinone oxidoreductase subunit 6 (subunit J)